MIQATLNQLINSIFGGDVCHETKIVFLIITIFISACGLFTFLTPTQEVIPPSATPQPPPAVPTTQPTTELTGPNPIEFQDDFDGSLLESWTWTREDPDCWSLATTPPGSLQINVGAGHFHDETVSNLLLRPAPAGDFQIETKLTFAPTADFQFAGLIFFESPSNLIQGGAPLVRAALTVWEMGSIWITIKTESSSCRILRSRSLKPTQFI